MKTSLNPIKPRSQMQRYSWLREAGVEIGGRILFGPELDAYIDLSIYRDNERAKARRREEPADGVQEE